MGALAKPKDMERNMVGYRHIGVWLFACMWSCGGTRCAGSGVYPSSAEDAGVLLQSARVRITQHGFDTLTQNIGAVLSSACEGVSSSCVVQRRGEDSFLTFSLGEPSAPLSFNTSVPVLGSVQATLRSGGRYADGSQAPEALVGLDMQGVSRNMRLVLEEGGASERDAVVVSLGCHRPNQSRCTSEDYVRGTLDLTLAIENGFLGDAACHIAGDGRNGRAFELKAFTFKIRPKVVQGSDGVRRLSLRDEDIEVQNFDLDMSLDVSTANADPACRRPASGGWFNTGFELADCRAVCGLGSAVETVADFVLRQNAVSRLLARTLGRLVFQQLGSVPMQGEGALDAASLIPGASRQAQKAFFKVAAGLNSPDVSSTAYGDMGLNVDLDLGVSAQHGRCVGLVPTPVWRLPPAPAMGGYVDVSDPATGALASEPVDVGVMVGDAALNRVAFELFDSGALCLSLTAEGLSRMSGGAFMPDTNTLGVIVPGLSRLGMGNAPVDMALLPTEPPVIRFGTGEGEGPNRDSHIQLDWKNVVVEMYPLLADTPTRVLAFSASIKVHLTLLTQAQGSVQLLIDRLDVGSFSEVYNEMGLSFEARGLEALLRTFLPLVLNGEPVDLDLGSALGLPLVPELKGVSAVGEGKHYLALLLGLCADCVEQPPVVRNVLGFKMPLVRMKKDRFEKHAQWYVEPWVLQREHAVLGYRQKGHGLWQRVTVARDGAVWHGMGDVGSDITWGMWEPGRGWYEQDVVRAH